MATLSMPATTAPPSTAVVAVAATSYPRLVGVLSVLAAQCEARSVLVIGVAKVGVLETYFAPTTGVVRWEDMQDAATQVALRVAGEAVAAISWDVAARHCACSGWRDSALLDAVSGAGCERLFVHASDTPAWRARVLRKWLADAGVSLVVVDPASTGRGAEA